jgi:hypothetical protein
MSPLHINLYQSSNVLGGGDLAPARGFHGNYASFNLKNRSEVTSSLAIQSAR